MPSARETLARRLQSYREAAGMDQTALAKQLGLSQAQVSRIEKVRRSARPEIVWAWLDATEVPADERADITNLLEHASTEVTPWKALHAAGWTQHQHRYEELQREAQTIRIYQPSLIPGLLQSGEYVAYLLGQVVGVPQEKLAEAISARLRRNAVLYRPDTKLDAVIAEHVLRANFGGPAVMAGQLHQIASLAQLPTVDVAVLPTDTAMPNTWGHSYVLLEMPDEDDSIVFVELAHDEVAMTDLDALNRYRELHNSYRAHALTGQAAIDLVLSIAAQRERAAAG